MCRRANVMICPISLQAHFTVLLIERQMLKMFLKRELVSPSCCSKTHNTFNHVWNRNEYILNIPSFLSIYWKCTQLTFSSYKKCHEDKSNPVWTKMFKKDTIVLYQRLSTGSAMEPTFSKMVINPWFKFLRIWTKLIYFSNSPHAHTHMHIHTVPLCLTYTR